MRPVMRMPRRNDAWPALRDFGGIGNPVAGNRSDGLRGTEQPFDGRRSGMTFEKLAAGGTIAAENRIAHEQVSGAKS